MKILITAFEPFGERDINASMVVMNALPEVIGQNQIIKELLPVDHKAAPAKMETFLQKYQPDAVISLGEASGTDTIRLEFVAINWMNFCIADNSGGIVRDKKIAVDGATAYFSTLPLREIEASLKNKNIPVSISMTAGTFLCNQIFYSVMHSLTEKTREVPAGFIHLPAEIVGYEGRIDNLDVERCVSGLKLILDLLLS